MELLWIDCTISVTTLLILASTYLSITEKRNLSNIIALSNSLISLFFCILLLSLTDYNGRSIIYTFIHTPAIAWIFITIINSTYKNQVPITKNIVKKISLGFLAITTLHLHSTVKPHLPQINKYTKFYNSIPGICKATTSHAFDSPHIIDYIEFSLCKQNNSTIAFSPPLNYGVGFGGVGFGSPTSEIDKYTIQRIGPWRFKEKTTILNQSTGKETTFFTNSYDINFNILYNKTNKKIPNIKTLYDIPARYT